MPRIARRYPPCRASAHEDRGSLLGSLLPRVELLGRDPTFRAARGIDPLILERGQLLDVLRGDGGEARAALHRTSEVALGDGEIAALHGDDTDIVERRRQH